MAVSVHCLVVCSEWARRMSRYPVICIHSSAVLSLTATPASIYEAAHARPLAGTICVR
jgi:hypothetical protein